MLIFDTITSNNKNMKTKIILLISFFAFSSLYGQRRNAPKMMPVLETGYYINKKNDTVWGKVQINPEDETEFYHQFGFKLQRSKKPKVMNAKMAKAYGFGGKNFVAANYDGQMVYMERLADGRLNFFEYRYHGKVDGSPAITSYYFIKDTQAEGEDENLRELKKISHKFYKKSLKPFMKDQLFIWTDLDKYNFELDNVLTAVKEFNKIYTSRGN